MKKALSLVLVLVMVLGMATVASAAVTKMDKNGSQTQINLDDTKLLKPGGADADCTAVGDEVDVGTIYVQGGVLTYYTEVIDFTPSAGGFTGTPVGTGGLTEKEIKNAKVTLKTVVSKGAAAIHTGDTKLVYDGPNNSGKYAQLRIVFNDEYKSNNKDGVDFTVKFFLVVDGRQWSESGFTVIGNYRNESVTYSDASDGYVWMGDGVIVEADAYGKNIEMDLDNGVSVFGKMFKEKKYWARSNMDSYNDDEDLLMDKYDIDTVYHIKQVGVAAVADYVVLNDESSDLFVYDGELNYLGKGNDKLAFSETYYLAAKELDVENDEEPIDEGEGDGYEVPGETGGDDYYPENVNDNPGTGR